MFDFIAKLIKGDRSRSSAGSGDAARQGEAPPARGELDAAEDSFSFLPVLEGTATSPIRPYLLTQAFGCLLYTSDAADE